MCGSYMAVVYVQNVPGQTGQSEKAASAVERWHTS
jgi:hypothetical protein